jgi:hypothetical protein
MLIIQSGRAKQFRKYSIAMAIIFAITGAFASILTMHWYVDEPKK